MCPSLLLFFFNLSHSTWCIWQPWGQRGKWRQSRARGRGRGRGRVRGSSLSELLAGAEGGDRQAGLWSPLGATPCVTLDVPFSL